jgi:hypothetical protein
MFRRHNATIIRADEHRTNQPKGETMTTKESEPKREIKASDQSIVRRPWEFACQWYGVDEIHHSINREQRLKQIGDVPAVPSDVTSRKFAEWLTEQYRLAMRKGAELSTRELMEASRRNVVCCNCHSELEIVGKGTGSCPVCDRQWWL